MLANNSAVYLSKPTTTEFMDEWIALMKSGSGERGIFNRGGLVGTLPKRRLDQWKGGIGMVLFWRGVWHTTDFLTAYFIGESKVVTLHDMTDGPVSFALGTIILLVTGVYVSAFIGNRDIGRMRTGQNIECRI
jgi:hypothetical protein